MPDEPNKVLIVDESAAVRGLIEDALTAAGFNCFVTEHWHEVTNLLANHAFSALLCDFSDPDAASDLLGCAASRQPECKLIVMIAAPGGDHLARALELGACDVVLKPLDPAVLEHAVCRAVSAPDDSDAFLSLRAAEALQHEEQLRQAALAGIRALVNAVEAKDPHTRRHNEHVAHYAVSLADFLDEGDALIEAVRIASLLHDIGKIGVADDILTREDALSPAEELQIRSHPQIGAEIIASLTMFHEEARLVRHHHENWNGSGYPSRLVAGEIPLGSRIIHVADSVDAMLMTRSYRDAYPVDRMLEELACGVSVQFDPALADAMIRWCRAHDDRLILPTPAPAELLA